MLKNFLTGLLVLFVLAATLAGYVQLSYKKDFNTTYPVANIQIVADSAMIEHGRYLAYGPAHCASCHTPADQLARVEAGQELPMIGGLPFNLPIATLYFSNLTPDVETGIGGMSDGVLYRMLRHNVTHKGEALPELMPFRNMSEYDVKSVIAFLRAQPAVCNKVPGREINFVYKALQRFAFMPLLPEGAPQERIERDTSILYGKYLAVSVANCRGCHTRRAMVTGVYTGPEYAGGMVFEPGIDTKGWKFVTPNLTSDGNTGVMANWTEEQFIRRFRMGRTNPGSPMPWASFARFGETDLKAIYRFLRTLEPIENLESGKVIPPSQKTEM